jgi:hypothetical protein
MNGALAQLLSEFRGREIVALLNRGNRGDGLVHLGGRQFLSGLAVPVREFRDTDDLGRMSGQVLLIYSAGAMARRNRKLQRLLKWLAPRFNDIVLLPDSFDLSVSSTRSFAQSWDRKYHVFCRELVSFDMLRQSKAKPNNLLLGHDLSFHLDLNPWASRPANGIGGVFRHDAEASYGRLPRELDAVEDAARGTERHPEGLLEFVARFAELHTDRTHAAIAAARMGRGVWFYPNSYFKNEAIYHHSLASMPQVHFVRNAPFSLRQYFRVVCWRMAA